MLIDLDEFSEIMQDENHPLWHEVRVPLLEVVDIGATDSNGRSTVFESAKARIKAIGMYHSWIRENTTRRVYHVASIFVFEDADEAFMFKLTLA